MVNKPHPHLNLIIQWASDPKNVKIQYFSKLSNEWTNTKTPTWDVNYDWRIKPEPKLDVRLTAQLFYDPNNDVFKSSLLSIWANGIDNVEFTFDGETRQLKSVRMI